MTFSELNQLGRYYLIRRIDSQPYCATYESAQPSGSERVIVTAFSDHFTALVGFAGRFLDHVGRCQRVEHPCVVRCFGGAIDEEKKVPYIVTEGVGGATLAELLTRNAMPDTAEIARHVASAGQGLRALHREGAIHRDIRPASLLVTSSGQLKVANLGRGGLLARDAYRLDREAIVGSPLYIAPEAVRGLPVDHRADMYSLAATAYHLFAGRPMFSGTSLDELLRQQTDGFPTDLTELKADFPQAIWDIIRDTLAKDPASRYADYDLFLLDWNSALRAMAARTDSTQSAPGVGKQIGHALRGDRPPSSASLDPELEKIILPDPDKVNARAASAEMFSDLQAIMPAKKHAPVEGRKTGPDSAAARHGPSVEHFKGKSGLNRALFWVVVLAVVAAVGLQIHLRGFPKMLIPSFLAASAGEGEGGAGTPLDRWERTPTAVKALAADVVLYIGRNGKTPRIEDLIAAGVEEQNVTDGYGHRMRIDPLAKEVCSSGPDGIRATADDFQYNWETNRMIKQPTRPAKEATDEEKAYGRKKKDREGLGF